MPITSPRDTLAAITQLPFKRPVRVLNLCADHERVIAVSRMRNLMPQHVTLVSGPGSAASICPQADVYQAIQLATRHPVTLLTADSMLRLPVDRHLPGPHSLADAVAAGADVRTVAAPVEAVLAAREQPGREMVYFVAGFETLLAPLAGMIVEGLPANLSVLVCGRRVEPLLERMLCSGDPGFDAVMLPGNRCAVTGTRDWERLADAYRLPSVVAGYTGANLLIALHRVLQQVCDDEARVDNCYQLLVRPEGNLVLRDQLERVFERADGGWRGVGGVTASGFRMRQSYALFDADHRFTDYRGEITPGAAEMPSGCDCAAVVLGHKDPSDCLQFAVGCQARLPYGPCMASDEGTCNLRSVAA